MPFLMPDGRSQNYGTTVRQLLEIGGWRLALVLQQDGLAGYSVRQGQSKIDGARRGRQSGASAEVNIEALQSALKIDRTRIELAGGKPQTVKVTNTLPGAASLSITCPLGSLGGAGHHGDLRQERSERERDRGAYAHRRSQKALRSVAVADYGVADESGLESDSRRVAMTVRRQTQLAFEVNSEGVERAVDGREEDATVGYSYAG